jgi:transcription elongation GreA/GreB family factor
LDIAKSNKTTLSLLLMTIKQKIFNHYTTFVHEKITLLQQILDDLKESGANETKSTAGDKHETALAMLQIEQANKRTQLQEALEQKALLEKIAQVTNITKIVHGSLIKTNKGFFYLSVALGKAVVDDVAVIAISPQSPLGIKLMGLCVHDKVEINGNAYLVEEIL